MCAEMIYKRCLVCGQPAAPSMFSCGRCGQPFSAPSSSRRRSLWVLVPILALLLLGALLGNVVIHALQPAYLGTWIGEPGFLTLYADGTGQRASPPGAWDPLPPTTLRYHADGNYLILEAPNDLRREPWSVSNDGQRLTLGRTIYQRVP